MTEKNKTNENTNETTETYLLDRKHIEILLNDQDWIDQNVEDKDRNFLDGIRQAPYTFDYLNAEARTILSDLLLQYDMETANLTGRRSHDDDIFDESDPKFFNGGDGLSGVFGNETNKATKFCNLVAKLDSMKKVLDGTILPLATHLEVKSLDTDGIVQLSDNIGGFLESLKIGYRDTRF